MVTSDSRMSKKLFANFEALPEDEQLIILVLAVNFMPIGQVRLQGLLRASQSFQPESIKKINPSLKAKFKKIGLVTFPPGGWQCERSISEILMKRAVKKLDFFKNLTAAIHVGHHSYFKNSILDRIKSLRLHIYQNNIDGFAEGMQDLQQEYPREVDHTLERLFFNSFDKGWFSSLHAGIRFLVLNYYLLKNGTQLESSSFYEQLFKRYFSNLSEQPVYIALSFIQFYLHKGQTDSAMLAYLMTTTSSAESLRLLGTYHFLQNHYSEAIDAYEQSLVLHKKVLKKRNVVISGLDGQFYVLVLLKIHTPKSLTALKKHLTTALKIEHDPFSYQNQRWIEGIDIYRGGKSSDGCHYLFNAPYNQSSAPYDCLLQALLLYWLDETQRVLELKQNKLLKSLREFCKVAHENHYEWFAAVSSLILIKLGVKDKGCLRLAKYYQNSPFAETLDFLPRVEQWERALMALTQLSALTKSNDDSYMQMRMIWQLSLENDEINLIPREQKISKTGRWTKGRPVALHRLMDDLSTFSYLSDQDLRICKQISTCQEDYYYGYQSKENYYLGGNGLVEAVGHPSVYWVTDEKMSAPIDVTKAEPQLLVKKQGENLHISLVPKIETEVGTLIERSATGVLVYDINEQHVEVAHILTADGLTVPNSARQTVIDSIASIASTLIVQSDIGGESVHSEIVEVDSRLHIHLQPIKDGLLIDVFIQPFMDGGPVYKPAEGGNNVLAEIEGKQLQTCRNFSVEKKYLKNLKTQCPELYKTKVPKWQMDDPEMALEALLQLQALDDFVVLEWPKGKKIRLNKEIELSEVRFSIRKEKNWFAVEGDDIALDDNNVLKMQKLFQLINGARGRFLKLKDGQFLTLTKELRQRLEDFSGLGEAHGDKLHFHPLATPILDEMTKGMTFDTTKAWKDQLKNLSEMSNLVAEVPSALQGTLRDYQLEGYQWMCRLAHWGAGACLADDMGLGKTIQALALILARAKEGATLILAPTSVCINWLEEAERFTPTLKVQHFGNGERQKMLDEAGAFDLIVCSYGLLQSEGESLSRKHWRTVVADEAQAIKNMQTKRSKAAMALQADFKLITTGTPIENHLGELWNLFNFINPGLFGSLKKFNEKYAVAIENNHDYATQQRLKKLLRPFILRRLKKDVLKELPPKIEITLHVEQSAEEKAMYEALRRTAVQTMERLKAQESPQGQQHLQVLAEIMKLRRACCNPSLVLEDSTIASTKLAAFEELVDELIGGGHKVLVFSQFIGHLAIIRRKLDEKGVIYQYLDGATSIAKRKKAVNAFQAGEGDLFLISLKAGGSGLNLTAADYVIHMDPWWNPAVEDQASDRAHRMGQTRPVTIYRLVTKDTIEEKIVDLHKHKRDLANNLLEGGDVSGKMSVEEIVDLIHDIHD